MQIDDLYLTVRVGPDETLWPDDICPIISMTVLIKSIYAVPALDLVLQDNVGVRGNKIKLEDGTALKISFYKNGNPETFRFRLMRMDPLPGGLLRIIAWGDEIEWFLQTTSTCYTGSSSEVVSQLAAECGLKSDVDATTDNQKWLGMRRKRYVFARAMAWHGYANPDSIMRLVYAPGRLRYRDINRCIEAEPRAVFDPTMRARNNCPTYLLADNRALARTGAGNLSGGYASAMQESESLAADYKTSYDKVQLPSDYKPQRNTEVANRAGTGTLNISRARSSNTHANYNRASYQNKRGMLLWDQRMRILTIQQTRLDPLDCVMVYPSRLPTRANGEAPTTAEDGKYLIDARVIQIRGNRYAEMLTALRSGINQ